jgi:hypothetical protein
MSKFYRILSGIDGFSASRAAEGVQNRSRNLTVEANIKKSLGDHLTRTKRKATRSLSWDFHSMFNISLSNMQKASNPGSKNNSRNKSLHLLEGPDTP